MNQNDMRDDQPSVSTRRLARVLPIAIVALGVAALVYGFAFSSTAIFIPQKTETPPPTKAVPPPMPPAAAGGEEFPSFVPPEAAEPSAPSLVKATVPESTAVREVTVGGLERRPDGTIERTYAEGAEKPALCPT